jgi:Rap1a immunity proteins
MLVPLVMLALHLAAQQGTPAEINVLDRGSTLYEDCQANIRVMDSSSASSTDLQRATACTGYIDGFLDGAALHGENRLCVGGASYGTMSRIYVAYVQQHPKLLDGYKGVALQLALLDSYRCLIK